MLRGKLALVTGASSGIGEAAAKVLSKEGAVVCGVGRNEEALAQLVKDGHLAFYVV